VTDQPQMPPVDGQSIDEVLAGEAPALGDTGPEEGSSASSPGERPTALDSNRANALAAERRPTVLVLAGAVGSGKTSVYAAIYERLGRGEFGGWMFAGSRTIAGLEERCFWWRTASGSPIPEMPTTRGHALPWLHIRLRDSELRRPAQELLLGDFDGERFQQVRDGVIDPLSLTFLRRADHVGVVIDGANIADNTRWIAERNDVINLLIELKKPGALADHRSLFLVVTKIDEFEKLDDELRRAANDALTEIHRKAVATVDFDVPLHRLAVRSRVPDFPLGHGLESLLEKLLIGGPVHINHPLPAYRSSLALGRFRG